MNAHAYIVAAGGANHGSLREACRRIGVDVELGDDPERMAAATIACGFVCYGLLMAARKNYERHIAKMASLMIALLSQPKADASEPNAYAG